MKAHIIEKARTIISNSDSKHNYFGWPTVAHLQNGTIAVGASGFRLGHICPFGKAVISFSTDKGETYSQPCPVIDTPLDDRDAGMCTFGKSSLIFTSVNNSADMQREHNKDNTYIQSYINSITKEDEEKYLGSTYRISHDCAKTFGPVLRMPVTNPHGPTQLSDGTIILTGNSFTDYSKGIEFHKFNPTDGTTEKIGKITSNDEHIVFCEAHLIELPDGRLLCQIRGEDQGETDSIFTIFQSISVDKGKTWSEPEMLLDRTGGAPPHLLMLSSGILLCTYSRRKLPYGIMAMISTDCGKTWQKDLRLYENTVSDDLGYPSTVELDDGTLLTVFYARDEENGPCVIKQLKWKII